MGFRTITVLLLTLTVFSSVCLTRPVSATSPDFMLTANPSKVVIPLGYWAETMLTITSLNGFQGTIQLQAPVGSDTGLFGAGFSTGMTLSPDGSVNDDLQLTPGTSSGDYNLNVTATIGSVTHFLVIPITVSSISGPDFITRLWGSYATLQERGFTIQEQLVSLGGFQGQVSLSSTITPNLPDGPVISFSPNTVDLSTTTPTTYSTIVSTIRTTPVGNYVVAVSASSGTLSHVYQALVMVGDYRPPSERPGPGNTTATDNGASSSSGTTISFPSLGSASSAISTLQSLWWLQTIIGLSIVTIVVYRNRTFRGITRRATMDSKSAGNSTISSFDNSLDSPSLPQPYD